MHIQYTPCSDKPGSKIAKDTDLPLYSNKVPHWFSRHFSAPRSCEVGKETEHIHTDRHELTNNLQARLVATCQH